MRFRGLPGNPKVLLGLLLALAPSAPARAALDVMGPDEVLARFVRPDGDRLLLTVDGHTWDLILDPNDASLSTLGDGRFHPMSTEEVEAAIAGIDARLAHLDAKVLVLPYPRRGGLKSSCEDGTIFLAPGLRPVHPIHVHATVTHEVGHVIQHDLVPDPSNRWSEYLRLRSIDRAPYSSEAVHRDRPHEIFAEDFRFLFGSALATSSGAIENENLPLPTAVAGLEAWFRRNLSHHTAVATAMHPRGPQSWPNPLRGVATLTVRFSGRSTAGSSVTAEVLDVAGRRVRTLAGTRIDGETVGFRWNARSETGSAVPTGIYFLRWRERPDAGVARVQVLH